MKLSKRLAAVVLILSMLLVSMPVFAEDVAEGTVLNTRTMTNTKVILPTDGSSVTLTNTYCGNANGFSIVLDDASAKTLGIDLDSLTSTITTAGTDYEGILLSGEIRLYDWTYRPGTANQNHKDINSILEEGQATALDFADIEVSHVRKSSGGALVLEIPKNQIFAKATNVKVYDGDVDFSTLTETTKIEQVEVSVPALTSELFSPKTGGYVVYNLTARAGENYWKNQDIDLGSLPEGTKFFATTPENLTYFGEEYGYTSDWNDTRNEAGMDFYTGSSNAFDGNLSGPFSIVTPAFSGEYYVYGLRKDCSNGGVRLARFNISGQKFTFADRSMVTWASTDTEWNTKDSFFWDKAANTVTFEAGKTYYFQNCGGGSSRLAAVAFVPVDAEGFTAPQAIVKENSLKDSKILKSFSAEDFAVDHVKTYTVKVDGEDFTAKPYYHQVHTSGESTNTYDFEQNVFGEPIKYATVAEVVALAKGVTVAEATENYQITVNGVREYAPEVMIAMPGDEIVIGTEALTSMNFNPINLGGKLVRFILADTSTLRFCVHATRTPAFLYDKAVHTDAATAPFNDAKLAGYLTRVEDDGYQGQKVYFLCEEDNGKSTVSGDKTLVIPHIDHYGKNSAIPTVTAETPEGTQTVHNPFVVYAKDAQVSAGVTVVSGYDTTNMYWVNGTVDNDIRVEEVNGKKVIRTDGCALIRVITKKADGSVETERVDLTPKDMYLADPEEGETIYVWYDTPWEGSTMKPVCAPIVAQ